MSMFILVLAFAAAVVFELWALLHNKTISEDERLRGNRECLRELRDIEQHRPDHVVR